MGELMKKDKMLLTACEASEVENRILKSYRARADHTYFGAKFYKHFPFRMTDSQKEDVVGRICKRFSSKELSDLQPDVSTECYTNAVMSAIRDRSSMFHCPICMDPMVHLTSSGAVDTSGMWFAPLRKTEHWSNHPCGHACCH